MSNARHITPWAALLLTLAGASPALADEGEALAREKGCFACHNVDTAGTAPAFREIARRYGHQSNARDILVPLVHAGSDKPGIYHWGSRVMPPEGARRPVTDEEAEAVVDYILGLH